MDFAKAALVVGAVFALVEMVKAVEPRVEMSRRWTVLTALGAGQAAVWGLATTVWAQEQVIGGHTLDTLNSGSKVAAGFFVALLATGLDKALGAVRSIGENEVNRPIAK
jgi:hypothetical protein